MLLFQLPEDVLYHILSYLDCKTLSRLSQVSKVICHIVSRDVVWKNIAKGLLNTGITRYWTDIYPHILLKDRVKTAQNWCDGVCKRSTPLKWKTNDGKILVHNRRSDSTMKLFGHNQEVNCIDSRNELIVSGSRDQTIKIWTLASSCPRDLIPLYDRVWSVVINPTLSSFVTGTACCENLSPLRIWDVERLECVCSLGSDFRRGAGVLDMVFETPFHLFTCGYDTFIRLWDLRLSPQKSVMEWEEPHDSALYCMQTDGNHMIASGSSYYGVVRLWDKRLTECLQFFQLSSDLVSSPVYCLRFSSSHLYAALATALHSLDFRHNLNITIR
ncbi:F-box/WD repeat-containing protein 4 isoform X3 [Hippocampus comes]|uniref:F-box/WD repeat-containing protein 4 isoform X3 n=1 Tax=Hippocampus comes TaxID=109280 RepID=UPI00094E3C66|nr:PREDICTED: F-box/WD repeat-containing protein 4 isoform X3 [Hippocampus comes]